jgi:lipopolysaccharide biosynthesis glycosyltransferase
MINNLKKLIVFTIDDNYVDPFSVAIESFSSHHIIEDYAIGLVYSQLSESNLVKIRKMHKLKGIELIEKKIVDEFSNISMGYHFNSVIFYRWYIPELFKEYKKVLYIDSDILFLAPIDDIFNIPILEESAHLAAIEKSDITGVPRLLTDKIEKYFASGLLLINIEKFVKDKIFNKAKYFVENESFDMPDQDALNCVVDKWLPIDKKYGLETSFLENYSGYYPQVLRAVEDACIVQFSGYSKPWHYGNEHKYQKDYWDCFLRTPFARPYPINSPLLHKIKCIAKFGRRCLLGRLKFALVKC